MACTLLMLVIGGYYAYRVAAPLYSASAEVMLNNREEKVVDIGNVLGGLSADASVVNTEVLVLRSRALLGKVADELSLELDPEFNRLLRPPTFTATLKKSLKALLGLENAPLNVTDQQRTRRHREATINGLQERIEVQNITQSLVFRITVTTTDPGKSALIADTIIDLYILEQIETKFEASQKATSWLTDRVAELEQKLEADVSAVQTFRAQLDITNNETLEDLERRLVGLRNRVSEMSTELSTTQDRLTALEAAKTPEEIVDALGSVQLGAFLPRLDVPEMRESFDAQVAQQKARLEANVSRLTTQRMSLMEAVDDLETALDARAQDLIELSQLERESEASRLLYEHFLGRLKETSAQQGIQQADSRLLSEAVLPIGPSAPQKGLILLMSMVLGLAIGVVILLIREARANVFRSAQELEDFTGQSVFGQLPLISAKKRTDVIGYLRENPASAAAEAVRNLRTTLSITNIDNPPQVIMNTSSIPGEGKTTVSFALAHSFGGVHERVLLIEGDSRRRVFKNYFKVPDDKNNLLTALTSGQDPLDFVIHNEHMGVDILLAGDIKASPADIYASDAFAKMIARLRESYDKIIIDTPPALIVPDARVIAHLVDAILLVVSWDSTPRPLVAECIKEFTSVGHKVDGLVLNKISPRGMQQYGYYSSGYGAYRAYGGHYYTET